MSLSPSHPRPAQRRAFTLIELLVVIAIIAILAAILFPVFARARQKAQQAACQSNLKQIAMGFLMYMQDYDETMPIWTADACNLQGASSAFWMSNLYYWLVNPYIKNGVRSDSPTGVSTAENAGGQLLGVWACPTAKSQLVDALNSVDTAFTTYAYNYYSLGGTANCPTTSVNGLAAAYAPFDGVRYKYPPSLAELGRPAETFMVHDGAQLSRPPAYVNVNGCIVSNFGVWGTHQPGTGVITPSTGANTSALNAGAYNRMYTGRLTMVAYADGHVKAIPTMSMISSKCAMEDGAWRGTLLGDSTPQGNAGWARDW
jgi:prepilin-type N-terminal cleavage/methylation domain